MGMVDGLIEGLANTPAVQEAMQQFVALQNGVVQAMTHFNSRFDAVEAKLDKIIYAQDHPSDIAPAGDDGLMKLLSEDGKEMEILDADPMPLVTAFHESEV